MFIPVKIDGPVHDPANHTYWFGPFPESVALIDMNGDGKLDIANGRNWYEAPNWVKHTNYRDGAETFGPITDDGGEAVLDVNRDGKVSSADVTGLRSQPLGTDTTVTWRYDINGDNKLSSADVTLEVLAETPLGDGERPRRPVYGRPRTLCIILFLAQAGREPEVAATRGGLSGRRRPAAPCRARRSARCRATRP